MKTVESSMAALARELAEAKEQEKRARARRLSIQAQLMESIPQELVDGEGRHTIRLGSEKLVLRVHIKMNRRIDPVEWDGIRDLFVKLPEDQHPVRYRPTIAKKGLEWIRKNDPDLYVTFCGCMTEIPGLPSVEVEE